MGLGTVQLILLLPASLGIRAGPEQGLSLASGGPSPSPRPAVPHEGTGKAFCQPSRLSPCDSWCRKLRTTYSLSHQWESAQPGFHTTATLPQESAASHTGLLGSPSDRPFLILWGPCPACGPIMSFIPIYLPSGCGGLSSLLALILWLRKAEVQRAWSLC